MRRDLGKAKAAKAGDLVVISLRLPKSQAYARLSIWSRAPGFDFAPHVNPAQVAFVQDGRPQLLSPLYAALNEKRRYATLQFVAHDAIDVMVRQEVDSMKDAAARARIKVYGTFAQKVRRYCGNAFRQVRRCAEACVGKKRRNQLV